MRPTHLGIAIAAIMAISVAASSPAQDGSADDLVVIGRKLRKVRLSYSWTGRSLEHCLVETSSGDANIDRIMCRILRTCVKQGHAKIDEAKRCMNRRVDVLIEEARRVGNDRIAPVPDDLADETTASPQQAVTSPPVTAGEGEEIVVEGQRNPIRGGLWQIERTNVFRSGGAGEMPESSAYRFNLCLPDTSVRQMLERAANERLQRPGMNNCGPMNLAMDSEFAILRFACLGVSDENVLTSLGTRHELSLFYGRDKRRRPRKDAITAVYMIELDKRGSLATYRRGGTRALAGYIMYSNAIRIGDCLASNPTSSTRHDDVMPLLFDLNEVFDSKGRPLECPRWWKPYIPVKCGTYYRPPLSLFYHEADQVPDSRDGW